MQEVRTATLVRVCLCVSPGRLDGRVQEGLRPPAYRSLWASRGVHTGVELQQFRQHSLSSYFEQVAGQEGAPIGNAHCETSRKARKSPRNWSSCTPAGPGAPRRAEGRASKIQEEI